MTIADDQAGELIRKAAESSNGEVAIRTVQGLSPAEFTKIEVTYPDASTEVYTYKLNGTTVGVVTVVYTDGTKAVLSSAERTS